MSSFVCDVRQIKVAPHPNADLLEIGSIDGYQFVVGKGEFQTGDFGVYIPEQAILPPALLAEMGLTGKLAGPEGNRVRAITLRGVLSQGLFYRPAGEWPGHWVEGYNAMADLAITKWEPVIPTNMSGETEEAPTGTIFRSYTDVENIKRFPQILVEGEPVIISEKLHGSNTLVAVLNGQRVVSSKGLSSKQLVLKEDRNNVYWRIANTTGLFERLERYLADTNQTQVILYGEVLGVQDLMYDLPKGKLDYRAFDLYNSKGWVAFAEFEAFCLKYQVAAVPVLYQGPLSQAVLDEHTNGKSTIANNLREGVVIRPAVERYDPEVGRVILKSISPGYLTRKGGTELN